MKKLNNKILLSEIFKKRELSALMLNLELRK